MRSKKVTRVIVKKTMQIEVRSRYIGNQKNTLLESNFFIRIKKLSQSAIGESRIWRPVLYVAYAAASFLIGLKVIIDEILFKGKPLSLSLGALQAPLLIYLAGTYLTLLPNYIILILVFLPIKKVMPLLALISFISFLSLLAI